MSRRTFKGRLASLTDGTKAVAGLAGALATIFNVAAYLLAPTGIAALAIGLGLRSPPLVSVAAGTLGMAALATAAVYGLVNFLHWIFGD